jgi:hypothetical protein
MLVVDPRHWLTKDGHLPEDDMRQRRQTLRIARLIVCGGPLPALHSRETLVECSKRPGRKPCLGLMWVTKTDQDAIFAYCPICEGDEVLIHNWQGTLWAEGMMDVVAPDGTPWNPERTSSLPSDDEKISEAALPEFVERQVRTKIGAYCEGRVPAHAQHQVRMSYDLRGSAVTLVEQRIAFQDPSQWVDIPIAQLRYDPDLQQWTLYCSDRNGRWHRYEPLGPQKNLEALLREIDADPTGIFWG